MKVLAIDPGPIKSAIVVWDGGIQQKIFDIGIMDNEDIKYSLSFHSIAHIENYKMVIEKVACYGMPVGESIFETVFWSGRFAESFPGEVDRIKRKDVKMHLCGNVRAKDSNVIQALVDRFTPFEKNKGKGTKKNPGFFYGFKKDIWQAFALAVTWWDLNNPKNQK